MSATCPRCHDVVLPSHARCTRCGHLDDAAFADALARSTDVRGREHAVRNLYVVVASVFIVGVVVASWAIGDGLKLAVYAAFGIGGFCARRAWIHHHKGSIMLNLAPTSLTPKELRAQYDKASFSEFDRR